MDTFPEIPDYEVLYCLGYGARSTIYAVSEKRTGQLYALKRVLRRTSEDDRFIEQAEQEFAIASQFDHPVLRKAYKLIKRRKLLKVAELYVVMELFDGTSIDVHRPATLTRLIQVFSQVAQGLGAMHKLGYVHADIKPNNILVNDAGNVKIIDFGQSCPIGTVKTRIQGTPGLHRPRAGRTRSPHPRHRRLQLRRHPLLVRDRPPHPHPYPQEEGRRRRRRQPRTRASAYAESQGSAYPVAVDHGLRPESPLACAPRTWAPSTPAWNSP